MDVGGGDVGWGGEDEAGADVEQFDEAAVDAAFAGEFAFEVGECGFELVGGEVSGAEEVGGDAVEDAEAGEEFCGASFALLFVGEVFECGECGVVVEQEFPFAEGAEELVVGGLIRAAAGAGGLSVPVVGLWRR